MSNTQDDYKKYRGKCKEFCEEAIRKDPTLTMVRGHYYCPIWNSDEPHWWLTDTKGEIIDPTKKQFPSKGIGIYTEFNGMVACGQCGVEIEEEKAKLHGNYGFCSNRCACIFVGIPFSG